MIALIENTFVEKKQWISHDKVMNIINVQSEFSHRLDSTETA